MLGTRESTNEAVGKTEEGTFVRRKFHCGFLEHLYTNSHQSLVKSCCQGTLTPQHIGTDAWGLGVKQALQPGAGPGTRRNRLKVQPVSQGMGQGSENT